MTLLATYSTRCPVCDRLILSGDPIAPRGDGFCHASCSSGGGDE